MKKLIDRLEALEVLKHHKERTRAELKFFEYALEDGEKPTKSEMALVPLPIRLLLAKPGDDQAEVD
jgi:hypothetical protein